MIFYIFFLILATNAQNKMDMCYITIKNFETEGLSPMDVQRAADGVMIEINYKGHSNYVNQGCEKDKDCWVYLYRSKTKKNGRLVTKDRRYNWYGTDNSFCVGMGYLDRSEGYTFEELQKEMSILAIKPEARPNNYNENDQINYNIDDCKIKNENINMTEFDHTWKANNGTEYNTTFYNFGRDTKTMLPLDKNGLESGILMF